MAENETVPNDRCQECGKPMVGRPLKDRCGECSVRYWDQYLKSMKEFEKNGRKLTRGGTFDG